MAEAERVDKRNPVEVAADYARHGFRVHPLKTRDKGTVNWEGMTEHGCLDATTDLDTIKKWWEYRPDANVGIATGKESGVWVLDVDGDEGFQSLNELVKTHGAMPRTVTCNTGSGGLHYYYRHPGWRIGNSRRKMPGLDTRGDGGYVVAPPSIHPNGNAYQWQDGHAPGEVEVAEAPPWLLKIFAPPLEIPANITPAADNGEFKVNPDLQIYLLNRAITQAEETQGRHPTAVWLAKQLQDNRIPLDEARKVMIAYQEDLERVDWNPKRIMRPAEVLKVVNHIYQKCTPREPWTPKSAAKKTSSSREAQVSDKPLLVPSSAPLRLAEASRARYRIFPSSSPRLTHA